MYFIAGNLGFLTAQIEKKTNDDLSQKKEYVVYLVYDTANSSGHANSVRAVHLMSHGGKRGDYGTLPAPTTHEIYDKSQMSASMIRDCCNHTQTRFVWRLRLSLSCYREHFIESKPPKFGPRASLGRLLIRAAFLPADDKRSRHTEAKYCLGILTGTHSGPESRGRCRVAAVERATPSVAYVRSTRT